MLAVLLEVGDKQILTLRFADQSFWTLSSQNQVSRLMNDLPDLVAPRVA